MIKVLQRALLTFGLLVTLLSLSCGHNYQRDISKRLETLYGVPNNNRPINGYIFAALLPSVGTMFCTNYADRWPIAPDNGCQFESPATYFVAGVSDEDKKALLAAIITPVEGGTFTLSDDMTKGVKFDLAMPLLGNLADLNANTEYKKHVTVTINGNQVVKRVVNWDPLLAAQSNGKFNERMREHLAKRDFILAAADIVISGYTATVKVDSGLSASAKSKLEDTFKALAKESSGSVNLDTSNTGSYKFESANPVVVAALYVRPPEGGGHSGARTDVTKWKKVRLSIPGRRLFAS